MKCKAEKLGLEISKKLLTISAAYSYEQSIMGQSITQKSCKLWEDRGLKMYLFQKHEDIPIGFSGHARRGGRSFSSI